MNANGAVAAGYTYDAWGRVLTSSGTQANINPIRYRGYYYDSETGLYYLQSRYYDPEVCRFINADVYASTGQGILGCNMFAYCGNNPIVLIDESGKCGILAICVSELIIASGITIVSSAATAYAISEISEFSKSLRASLSAAKDQMPQVHHIVPKGKFESRSALVQEHVLEMQTKLSNNGISVMSDVFNLMLVSTGTHSKLHTDSYIEYVYNRIMAADNTPIGIYTELFWLRIEISSIDRFANGY